MFDPSTTCFREGDFIYIICLLFKFPLQVSVPFLLNQKGGEIRCQKSQARCLAWGSMVCSWQEFGSWSAQEHSVWSQALAEELSIQLVQPRLVLGQLELCQSFAVQIGGIFSSPVPQFPHCWIAHLYLLSLDEKHKRYCVKAEIFW